jgi:pimeloyl-ACP methyl ester carboxylesterase
MRSLGAIAVTVVLAAAAACVRERTENGLVVRSYRTSSPSRVPIVEVSSRSAGPHRAVAFLVHGFQCNSSMMMPLAKQLAAQGIDAYAMDLPGHGASLERFSEQRARDAAREAIDAVLSARETSPERVVLVGHSYGADVLARIAGDGRYRAMVMLGPSYGGGLSPRTPADLLVLTAEREHPHIAAFSRDMIRSATDGAIDAPDALRGELGGGARGWQVVAGTDHVSLLFSAGALERTSRWITGSLGTVPSSNDPDTSPTLAFAALALVSAVVLARAVAVAWPSAARSDAAQPPKPAGPAALAAVCAVALALAVMVGRHFTALAWLRLYEGERIASLLAIAGISMVLLGGKRVPWPSVGQVVRALPIAAAAFVIVYLAAVHAADERLYRLSLAGIAHERHGAAITLTAALSPFFAFAGVLLDHLRIAHGGGTRGATWAGAAAVALSAGVAAALPLMDPGLGRFAVPFGAVCLFAIAVGAILAHAARSCAVGAIFSSAMTSWVIAVGFVRF